MELIGIFLAVVIGYSIVQGMRRGEVTDEERKENPTLIESFSDAMNTVESNAYRYRRKAKFETEHLLWFRNFRRFVSNAFEDAKFKEDLDLKLSHDPKFRRLFDEAMEHYSAIDSEKDHRLETRDLDQTWYLAGIPDEPADTVEPEINEDLKNSYARHLTEHHQFVQDIRKRLSKNPQLAKFFRDALSDMQLDKLYVNFFEKKVKPNTRLMGDNSPKALKPYLTPNFPSFYDITDLKNLPAELDIQEKSKSPESTSSTDGDLTKEFDSFSGHIVEPPLNELERLPTPLEAGERKVLSFFLEFLDLDWEIYIQPHLNGLRPDFVLLNPKVGIGVFEVKNWNFEAVKYFPKEVTRGYVELWGSRHSKQFSKESDNPFRKIALYKEQIFNIYCPRLQRKAGFAAITGGIIFPSASSVQVAALQESFLTDSERETAKTYLPASGRDDLATNNLSKVFPDALRKNTKVMAPALADDLRSWLVEPDFSKAQRHRLPLDHKQRQLAESRTASGFRRIKGPAGSGKSLVLAARAARLASKG